MGGIEGELMQSPRAGAAWRVGRAEMLWVPLERGEGGKRRLEKEQRPGGHQRSLAFNTVKTSNA